MLNQHLHRIKQGAIFSVMALSLVACSTMPAFGPTAEVIAASAIPTNAPSDAMATLPYRIIEVSAATLPGRVHTEDRFSSSFRAERFRTDDEKISVGDQLEISIWEISEDGLFASAGQRETQLSVTVSNSGNISAPYAGVVVADGATTSELRMALLDRYRGRAVEPEIAVSITATDGRTVAILGAVAAPGRATIPSSGIRVLDLIAQVGGASFPPWEVEVMVQRGNIQSSTSLDAIVSSSTNNIVLLPNDIVTLEYVPRRFAVYVAVNRPGNIEITPTNADFASLIAQADGLNDRVAEAKSAFVFRPSSHSTAVSSSSQAIAYRLDFSRPDALLLAQQLSLKPDDIIYIASAGAADFNRFVSLVLKPFFGTVSAVNNIGG